jgi:predicted Zn-dependent protease
LRANGKLAELDMLYDAAPPVTQCDAAVISSWCSVPRVQRNGPEAIRRAQEILRLHPEDVKARSHMIFALHVTRGYEEAVRHAEIWMREFPDNHNIIGATATIALDSGQPSVAEQLLRKMDKAHPGSLDAGMWRMLVIALRQQGKTEEAAQAFREARHKYPDNPVFADL